MGKQSGGMLYFTGKVGNVVGFIRNGKHFIKAAPGKGSKKEELVPAQLPQQTKFAMVHEILAPIKSLLRISFTSRSGMMSPYNAAVSYTVTNVIKGTYPDFYIDWPQLKISDGKMQPFASGVVRLGRGKVYFSWLRNFGLKEQLNDYAILAVYSPHLMECIYSIGASKLGNRRATIDVKKFKGQEVHTYIAFISQDYRIVSACLYTGSGKVL
jgi:hypothetical protein